MSAHNQYLRQLRAGHPAALRDLRLALRAHGGRVLLVAEQFGVDQQALRYAIKATPEGVRILAKHGFGRTASAAYALQCRYQR